MDYQPAVVNISLLLYILKTEVWNKKQLQRVINRNKSFLGNAIIWNTDPDPKEGNKKKSIIFFSLWNEAFTWTPHGFKCNG